MHDKTTFTNIWQPTTTQIHNHTNTNNTKHRLSTMEMFTAHTRTHAQHVHVQQSHNRTQTSTRATIAHAHNNHNAQSHTETTCNNATQPIPMVIAMHGETLPKRPLFQNDHCDSSTRRLEQLFDGDPKQGAVGG
jgi:hypothetical protein